MPCTANTVCTRTDTNNYAFENLTPTGDPNGIYANMGWVGFAKLRIPTLTPGDGTLLRVTSADINLSQEITMPDVIDGRIDRTVYQLGPKLVEGSVSLPVIADVDPTDFDGCPTVQDIRAGGQASTLLDHIWCWTTSRGPQGRLLYSDAEFDIRYANHAAYRFDRCMVNTLSMTVTQGDVINFDINVIGRNRTKISEDPTQDDPSTSPFLSPARVLTWNDATVNGVGGCGEGPLFYSNQVREFSFEINNNADRYYTLNGILFPVDINVSKREITGSMTLLGLADRLRNRAETNQDRFTQKDEVRMQLFIGEEILGGRDWTNDGDPTIGNPIWFNKFTGVIFQIEEVAMTNEVLESTVNWIALGNDQTNFEALQKQTSCSYPAWG